MAPPKPMIFWLKSDAVFWTGRFFFQFLNWVTAAMRCLARRFVHLESPAPPANRWSLRCSASTWTSRNKTHQRHVNNLGAKNKIVGFCFKFHHANIKHVPTPTQFPSNFIKIHHSNCHCSRCRIPHVPGSKNWTRARQVTQVQNHHCHAEKWQQLELKLMPPT